jgi:hypothetical protein
MRSTGPVIQTRARIQSTRFYNLQILRLMLPHDQGQASKLIPRSVRAENQPRDRCAERRMATHVAFVRSFDLTISSLLARLNMLVRVLRRDILGSLKSHKSLVVFTNAQVRQTHRFEATLFAQSAPSKICMSIRCSNIHCVFRTHLDQ